MTLLVGDCRDVLAAVEADSIDACVTDPPYDLAFMGKAWDQTGVAFDPKTWTAVLRVLKPGAHLLAFGGTRTYHRMACAIEDAGFEIRDQLAWIYGSGFPKSLDVSKAIDKAAGAERLILGGKPGNPCDGNPCLCTTDNGMYSRTVHAPLTAPSTDAARAWSGWGTALKPAQEPIALARKPFKGTVAANVLAHGTGALNVDGCRIEGGDGEALAKNWDRIQSARQGIASTGLGAVDLRDYAKSGRWPSNVLLDEEAAAELDRQSGATADNGGPRLQPEPAKDYTGLGSTPFPADRPFHVDDSGGASRFFYVAKPDRAERDAGMQGAPETVNETHNHGMTLERWPDGSLRPRVMPPARRRNVHPTVKPAELMRYLCRLITPPGGLVLDPFTGSGTTGAAAIAEGFRFLGVELSAEYAEIARRRIGDVAPLFAE